jgi:uncharacterized cupredoxin-like copper-binding protein
MTAVACGGDKPKADLAVTLDEWSVEPTGNEVAPGEITFVVTNEGGNEHELVVIRSDLPPNDLPLVDEGVDESKLVVVGRSKSFAPGETANLTLDLSAGKYLLICNRVDRPRALPAVGHYRQGMVSALLITR